MIEWMKNDRQREIPMTRKLYYEDCHLLQFTATVTGCEATDRGWEVALDATAFYPGGGGQACDIGILGGAAVLETYERGEEIIHLCDGPLEVGQMVGGSVDFDRRVDMMQQHTGEHIVSGIICRRYGCSNKGFHIGADVIQIDFDAVIPPEDLARIEEEANWAMWHDVPIRCWYPSREELDSVYYRSKKELPWPVRVVQVPGYDSCACCGIHVERTGEVGLVKLLSVVSFRGGSRLELVCGQRAMKLLNTVFDQNRQVSQAFSARITETGEAARRMNEALAAEKFRATAILRKLFGLIADNYVNWKAVLHFEDGLEPVMVRELADAIADRAGIAAVFSGADGEGFSFCLVSRGADLRALGKAMTAALSGRGGGKPNCQQGKIFAGRAEIEAFFSAQESFREE